MSTNTTSTATATAIPAQTTLRHVVVIHRFSGPVVRYQDHLDHAATHVTYLVTETSRGSVPVHAATEVVVMQVSGELVATESDLNTYTSAVRRLARRWGRVDGVVALYEGDLLAAAIVRDRLGIEGARPDDVLPFRDKELMAQLLAGSGIDVPATVRVGDANDVRAFAAEHGWPLFLKPATGSASMSTRKLHGPEDLLPNARDGWGQDLVVQPFVEGAVLHVDGIWDGTALAPWRASRYERTCYDYSRGSSLGSVELDGEVGPIRDAAASILARLSERPIVFHLELFARGHDEQDLTFLEVACRPGGAEIPYVWRDVHDFDLAGAAIAADLGQLTPGESPETNRAPGDEVAGWLIVPPEAPPPCVVVSADSQLDREGVYAEVLPQPGTVMSARYGYESTGARFRLRGRDTAHVRSAIREISANFRLVSAGRANDTLVVLGTGGRAYREYGFANLRGQARIVLICSDSTTWARAHADECHIVPLDRVDLIVGLVLAEMAATPGRVGVLTWDETLVETAAHVAEECGLPGPGRDAARACRDKAVTRELLSEVSPVASVVAGDYEQARSAAREIGYPVVLKPRALAGSAGVVIVADESGLMSAYATASTATFPGLASHDCLVEEYLDGPEISIDCVVVAGRVACVNVARKRLGFEPYAEEVGHLVAPWRAEAFWPATEALVHRAHAALGIGTAITHAEVRLTATGPRIVEINCRLGGDFIPYLALAANGFDVVAAGMRAAMGDDQLPEVDDVGYAEVAFAYPTADGVVMAVDVSRAQVVPAVREVQVLAEVGQVLRLPPRGVVPRSAAVIATALTAARCSEAVSAGVAAVEAHLDPLAIDAVGGRR